MTWGGGATAFVLTVGVELVVYLLVLVPRGVAWPRMVIVGLLANVATHPVLWWTISRYDDSTGSYLVALAIGEAAACVVEWLVLVAGLHRDRIPPGDLAIAVLLANAVSAGVGLAIALVQ